MEIINSNSKIFWSKWNELINSAIFQYPLYSKIGIEYCKEFFSKRKFEDCSFIVVENSIPLVGVIMSMDEINDIKILSGFGREIGRAHV